MKKISLFVALIIFSAAAFSQACPVITASDIITLGPGSYQLHVAYTASGQKHIVDSIFCGNTLVSMGCIDVKGDGSYDQNFSCTGGAPSVVLIPGTGTCINGTNCGTRIFICPSCGPLPVTLSDFNAQFKNKDVIISWQTQMELNSSHFDILRSYDNSNFEKIGSVANLSANSNIIHNYSFTDYNSASPVTFYKLKIVDLDGRFFYSNIKVIKRGNSGKPDFIIFPNPAISNSSITISGISEPAQVQLFDNSGRILKTVNLISSNTIELSGIQKGNYILMITKKNSGQMAVKKLTVVN